MAAGWVSSAAHHNLRVAFILIPVLTADFNVAWDPRWGKYRGGAGRRGERSRASDKGVNPTRSQNRTEHTRRSATGISGPELTRAGEAAAGAGS